MKAWGKGFTGIALACALSACGGGGDSGDGGVADPNSFSVSATVGGTKVQTFSASSGQTATLTVKSGQDLRLDSSTDVNWKSGDATSNTEVSVKGASTQSWTAGLKSPPGGTFTVTVTSAKDASKSAKVTVTVTPHEYTAGTPKVGRVITQTETNSRLNGTTDVHERASTTVNVDTTAGVTSTTSTLDGAADESYTSDLDANRLSRTYQNGNVCRYTPKRPLVNFPLFVGKTWSASWQYGCVAGYQEQSSITSTVEAYEPLVTPMGTLNTLRIHHVIATTNSNDSQLQGGSTGTAAYDLDERCWWDVDGQRTVKCEISYAYKGTAPTTYLKSFSYVTKSVQ
ncbi:hypothetical protein ACTJK6_08390 [Ralstonia sp. 22086]|uniref:hypothetical protein n=1 Tax=Ralstonia TaxID=48736 RepID=UPI0039C73BC6